MLIQVHDDELTVAHCGVLLTVYVNKYNNSLCVRTIGNAPWVCTANERGGALLEVTVPLDAMPAICEPKPSQ